MVYYLAGRTLQTAGRRWCDTASKELAAAAAGRQTDGRANAAHGVTLQLPCCDHGSQHAATHRRSDVIKVDACRVCILHHPLGVGARCGGQIDAGCGACSLDSGVAGAALDGAPHGLQVAAGTTD